MGIWHICGQFRVFVLNHWHRAELCQLHRVFEIMHDYLCPSAMPGQHPEAFWFWALFLIVSRAVQLRDYYRLFHQRSRIPILPMKFIFLPSGVVLQQCIPTFLTIRGIPVAFMAKEAMASLLALSKMELPCTGRYSGTLAEPLMCS
jgi:hypothetical protein